MGTKIPVAGEIWRHSKSGGNYQVVGSTYNSITDQIDVLYEPLYPCEFKQFSRQIAGHEKAWISENEDGSARFVMIATGEPHKHWQFTAPNHAREGGTDAE